MGLERNNIAKDDKNLRIDFFFTITSVLDTICAYM